MTTTIMYTVHDLADALQVTRQAVEQRVERSEANGWKATGIPKAAQLPKPDAYTTAGKPLWKQSTLERAGILKVRKTRRST